MHAMMSLGRSGEKYVFEARPDGSFDSVSSHAELVELANTYELTLDGQQVIFDKTSGAILQTVSPGDIVTDFLYTDGRLSEVVASQSGSKHSLVLQYAASSGGGVGPGGPGDPGNGGPGNG